MANFIELPENISYYQVSKVMLEPEKLWFRLELIDPITQSRIAKYNPALRNESGVYAVKDWTSISDINKNFISGVKKVGENVIEKYGFFAEDFKSPYLELE